VNATHAAALQDLLDELGMTWPEFRQHLLEERAALQTPIDFADLERRGVLMATTGGWYVLLQPAALPAHVRKQARAVAQVRIGHRRLVKLQFDRPRRR
jgi:hypothetical protein